MEQLCKLVIVAVKRSDVALTLYQGIATVYVGVGPDRTMISADWHDDERIRKIILELTHSKFKNKQNLRGAA